jgi:hypothetical protein
MRPAAAAAADTIRALISAIPDDRLRELFIELALRTLACPAAATPGRGRGRRGRRAGRTPLRRSRAALDAINAKRREKRRLAALQRIAAGGTPKRRGRPKKSKSEGAHGNGNGRSATVSPAALWQHATKLEPKQPWRAVARELGVSDGAAQLAHRNLAMPANISPAAAARFLTL